MEGTTASFFIRNPEGAVIVALDCQRDGLLFGAVELRDGAVRWLDYELEFSQGGSMVSLFRGAEDTPALEYLVRGRRVDTVTPPDRLLILWNRSPYALAVDGDLLPPGEIAACAPQGITPWLLRFASWLPKWK